MAGHVEMEGEEKLKADALRSKEEVGGLGTADLETVSTLIKGLIIDRSSVKRSGTGDMALGLREMVGMNICTAF